MKALRYGLIVLVVLVVIGILVIPRILDPNQYKDRIAEGVKKATGRDLKMTGDMKLSLFPLEFRLPNVELSNKPGFGDEPFAQVKMAAIRADLLPLLKKQLVVDGVIIDGLVLNLARDQRGRGNWTSEKTAGKPRKQEPAATEPPAEQESETPVLTDFAVGKIIVRNSSVTWKDLKTQDSYAIRNLNMETGKIVKGNPLDLSLSFDADYGKPAITSHAELKGRYQPLPGGFSLETLELTLDDSRLSGTAQAMETPKLVWNFDLELDQLDVDRYLPKSETASGNKEQKQTQSGASPVVALRGINGNGSLKIDQFKVAGMRMNNVSLQMQIQDGLFTLGPNQAKLYGGTYRGNDSIDVSKETAVLHLDESLVGVQANELFKDIGWMKSFSGTGTIQIKASARGAAPADFKRSLNGSANLSLVDGKIQGVDLEKIIRDTKDLASRIQGKAVSAETEPTDRTLFRKFSVTFQFSNGVARTNNLSLEGNVLNAAGEGSADLMRENLDFKLKVTLTEPGETQGLTVPVLLKGTFGKPDFQVDWGDVAKSAGKQFLKELIRKKNKN